MPESGKAIFARWIAEESFEDVIKEEDPDKKSQ